MTTPIAVLSDIQQYTEFPEEENTKITFKSDTCFLQEAKANFFN